MSKVNEAQKIVNEIMSISNIMVLKHPNIITLFGKLEQALTPPTADEVCKALGEHYDRKVKYINKRFRRFYSNCDRNEIIDLQSLIRFPHLITLIGRFYEGEIK